MTPDTSGPMSRQPFAYYDPDSSSLRTSQGTFDLGLPTSSPTLPDSGSMRNGRLYERPTSEPPTGGNGCSSLPTPSANDAKASGKPRDWGGDLLAHLLPTPAVNDMGAGKSVQDWDAWTDKMRDRHGNGNGHGNSLEIEAKRLLPTPTTMDTCEGRDLDRQIERRNTPGLQEVARIGAFGPYQAAIDRWSTILGRPAPPPTETDRDGRARLNPRFVEWMMGLPQGWVTDLDLTRANQLKILGNGVVPQQAAHAITTLLHRTDP